MNNHLMRSYIPGHMHDDQPDSPEDPSSGRKGPSPDSAEPSMDREESKHNVSDNPLTKPSSDHGVSRTAGSMSFKKHYLTDTQDADMPDALRLAYLERIVILL